MFDLRLIDVFQNQFSKYLHLRFHLSKSHFMSQGAIMSHYLPLFFDKKNILLPRDYNIHIISRWRKKEPKNSLVVKLDHQGPLFSIFCHQTKPKICSFWPLRHKVSYATREFLPHFSPRALVAFNDPSACGLVTVECHSCSGRECGKNSLVA